MGFWIMGDLGRGILQLYPGLYVLVGKVGKLCEGAERCHWEAMWSNMHWWWWWWITGPMEHWTHYCEDKFRVFLEKNLEEENRSWELARFYVFVFVILIVGVEIRICECPYLFSIYKYFVCWWPLLTIPFLWL